ncbi:MAG TPA: prenyltransferase/squalene oxidase repeat-containing protein [Caldimonas sp.]|nr:prenyltransferase/squalene oxidase repeat-containing protein [Caldimonas sp.]HEX4234478.1 prenyltransferase/squalene oxidase repeat-containing protein [Caldimonas sp.]
MLTPIAGFARLALDDLRGRKRPTASLESSLLAAESWLCRAQDASGDGGVSYGYSLLGGWRPSYPETSGYIATTFLRLARRRDPAYAERAERILRWLLAIQNEDGSFANPRYGPQGIVFDTGQVLFALIRGYQASGTPELLAAARRAAGWLTAIADRDLLWTRNEHLDTPHVYNARTAWALLLMNGLEFDAQRDAVARNNLDWALKEQHKSGFFGHCAFERGQPPFSHTIAYTARGLLESGILLDESRYIDGAARCADAMLLHLDDDGHLPSMVATDGVPASRSCCLTGNCQFAIVWARLHGCLGGQNYRIGSVRALDRVMATQDLQAPDPGIRGGIKGSHPVWGRYAPMTLPNWAAKFFIDAMWLRKDFRQ